MRIIVLGNKGMLGSYVYNYFKSRLFNVKGLNRNDFDASDFETFRSWSWGLEKDDIVINCVGTIKPKFNDIIKAIFVNSIFPHKLQEVCEQRGAKLIHITTDCVFSGNTGFYDEKSLHDATDAYGKSKSLGEPKDACVIRTSIIGQEIEKGYSLLNWVISNKDGEINGFENHIWNGVTCLELAKVIESIIINNLFWKGVRHIFTKYEINKFDLCKCISDVYELNLKINNIKADYGCNRALATIYDHNFTITKSYNEQLIEQKEFFERYLL